MRVLIDLNVILDVIQERPGLHIMLSSEATLKALSNFAQKNQVLVFTNHRQVAEQAQNQGQGLVHRLDNKKFTQPWASAVYP